MTEIIMWCELCSKAPSDGILEVIRKGEVQVSQMHACQECVDKLPETQWLENQLGGHHV